MGGVPLTGGHFQTVARVHLHSSGEKMGGSFQQMSDVIWQKCSDRLVSVQRMNCVGTTEESETRSALFHQLRPEKVGAWVWGALEIEVRTDQTSPVKSESHLPC